MSAATPEVVAEDISWLPFGPADGWTHGNGIVTTRDFDADYRIKRTSWTPTRLRFF